MKCTDADAELVGLLLAEAQAKRAINAKPYWPGDEWWDRYDTHKAAQRALDAAVTKRLDADVPLAEGEVE